MVKKRMAAVAIVFFGVTMSGCDKDPNSGADQQSKGEPKTSQVVDGYPLPPDYSSALEYPANTAIFTVRVASSRLAKVTTGPESSIRYVVTSIDAVVTSVLKDSDRSLSVGQTVVLRVLGGNAGDITTVNDVTAGPDKYIPGSTIQVFAGQARRDSSTGEVQFVPNWTFGEAESSIFNLAHPEVKVSTGQAYSAAENAKIRGNWRR